MKALRFLLFPFTLIYGFGIALRNACYKVGLLKSTAFENPVICVGNLNTGGTGKTPHIEHIIRLLLAENIKVSTLSRGYGRQTSGYKDVQPSHTADEVGDEPLQFKTKFSDISVAVDGNRVRGCKKLFENGSACVLLDDAFQHRAVKPKLNILLTEYHSHYQRDFLLPTGNLREFRAGAHRADIVVVTKCPGDLSPIDRRRLVSELKTSHRQTVAFSTVAYGDILPINPKAENRTLSSEDLRAEQVILVTGIAKSDQLLDYLSVRCAGITHLKFSDHHRFDGSDIKKVRDACLAKPGSIILTTEKDYMRLNYPSIQDELAEFPLYYIPIVISFDANDQEIFDELILANV